MRDDYSRFQERGAAIAAVTQGSPEQTARLRERHHLPFTCLSDPERRAYAAYGLVRGSLAQVVGPAVMLKAALSAMRGNVGPQIGDIFQMPGTFVIDRSGVIRFAHRNRDTSDNPPNDLLLSAI